MLSDVIMPAVKLTDEDWRQIHNMGELLTQLTQEERDVIDREVAMLGGCYIDPEFYTAAQIKDIQDYYSREGRKLRAVQKYLGLPTNDGPRYDPTVDFTAREARRQVLLAEARQRLRKREFEWMTRGAEATHALESAQEEVRAQVARGIVANFDCPWEVVHRWLPAKRRRDLEDIIAEVREDIATAIVDRSVSPRHAYLKFVRHCTIEYWDVLWTLIKYAFAAGAVLAKLWRG